MSSNINDNISLNIKHGQGLSQAIDTELDKQLHQDVRLGLSDWQSIFNIIKEEQVQANNIQFDDKDKDIKNGRHFVVSAGSYEIAKKTWNKILDIAKNRLGIQTEPQIEETAQNENIRPALSAEALRAQLNIPSVADPFIKSDNNQEVQTTQQIVAQILKDAGVDTDGLDIDDIARKYDLIKRVNSNIDEDLLNERITNYAMGLRYHNFEKNSITDYSQTYESNCSKATTYEELRTSYQQFGKEYIEVFDMDGDLKANVHEIFYKTLIDKYVDDNMSVKEATEKAIKVLEKYKHYNINTMPDPSSDIYETYEMELFTSIMAQIGVLDENKDGVLSADESGSYLMSVAQLLDSKNDISAAEVIDANFALEAQDMTLEEIMNEFGVNEDEAKNIIMFRNKFDNNLKEAQGFIIKGNMPE